MLKPNLISLTLAGAALLCASCTLGTPKYNPPPKNYPTLFTFNKGMNDVWSAATKSLDKMGFKVASLDKASGKIETEWADGGFAPARKCEYGVNNYWENPARRQQLSIVVKKVPGSGAPAAPMGGGYGAPGGFGQPVAPGGFGQPAAPGGFGQPAAPGGFGQPAAPGGFGQPAAPGGFGAPGAAPGFPGAAPAAPAMGSGRTMVIVVSKGESVLQEDCGDQPGTIEIANTDTVTEYRFLHAVGQLVGQQMEPPPAD